MSNDNLVTNNIKQVLKDRFAASSSDFLHPETERAKSQFQLLKLIEERAGLDPRLTSAIKALSDERQKTAHSLSIKGHTDEIFVENFFSLCKRLTEGIVYFIEGVATKPGP